MVESADSGEDISEGSFSLTVDALTGIGASTGDALYDAGAPEPTEWVEDGELIDVVADHVQDRYHEDLVEDLSNQVFLASIIWTADSIRLRKRQRRSLIGCRNWRRRVGLSLR